MTRETYEKELCELIIYWANVIKEAGGGHIRFVPEGVKDEMDEERR